MPLDVAEDERGRLEPRDPAQRRQIGLQREVAVAALPARELVAGHRIHLHLEREQVVAALDRVAGADFLDEELAVEALAHEPPLHVGERHDDRVDRARLHVGLQLVEAKHEQTLTLVPSGTLTTLVTDARNTRSTRHRRWGGLMDTAPPAGSQHHTDDERELHKLGYAQELFRGMGGFQNFAISFTIISILAGCLTSYSIAYGQGGPVAITWGWLLVGAMSTLVALAMAEIASAYPDRRRPLLLGLEARQPRRGAGSRAGST